MHSVIVVIHLIIALGLVTLILLQRSEGGALGMGGGGGGGLMSGRAAGDVLSMATRWLGLGFFVTSIALTVFPPTGNDVGTVLDAIDPNAIVTDVESDVLGNLIGAVPDGDAVLLGDDLVVAPAGDVESDPESDIGDAAAAEPEAVSVPIDDE